MPEQEYKIKRNNEGICVFTVLELNKNKAASCKV